MPFPFLAAGLGLSALGSLMGSKGPGGRKEKFQKVRTYTPQQEGLINLHAMQQRKAAPAMYDYWNRLLSNDPAIKRETEAPVLSEFYDERLPQLAQVYGDASGDTTALQAVGGKELRKLQEGLNAQRHHDIRQAIGQMRSFADIGMTKPYEIFHRPGRPNIFSQLGGTAIGLGANLALARGLGLGPGAGLGGVLGSGLGSGLFGRSGAGQGVTRVGQSGLSIPQPESPAMQSIAGMQTGQVGGMQSAPGMGSLSDHDKLAMALIDAFREGSATASRERNLGRASGVSLTPAKPSSYHYTRRTFR
ncbi:MAG: hypothetical protein OXF02_06415 [Simkaniaceae bacterium]|nr:hypothetical protein [Simkaniaceae bacterium]